MAEARTAEYLCDRARFYVGENDPKRLRNGFDDDRGESPNSILPSLNEAVRQMISCGVFKCTFSLTTTAETQEYPLDSSMGQIETVTFNNKALTLTDQPTLFRTKPGWNTQNSGTPTQYYNDVSDILGLFPMPSSALTLKILAEATAEDLVLPTDYITRLPVQFHEDASIGAAIDILTSMGDQVSLSKIAILMPRWNNPDDPNMPGALQKIQAFAQKRQIGQVGQFSPREYRRRPRSGFR